MAASELHRRSLRLERVESVTAETNVRHVDQLDAETLESFYTTLEDDLPGPGSDPDLEDGEVIVFTDYYRVKRI
ncbi:hypothetical protein [Natronorubrum halophilum]|uniref:hypothetical protein n=1 Tax=Natronorubrum halophilum TaxID=1702106 RepID=UPI003743C6E6